jgi:hypothetical protein
MAMRFGTWNVKIFCRLRLIWNSSNRMNIVYRRFRKWLQAFRGVWYSLKWAQKYQSAYVQKPMPAVMRAMFVWPLQQMLCVVPMHFNTTFSSVSQRCALSKIPGFTRICWQAFSTLCCNTSRSLVGAEYTKALRCPHSQKSRVLGSGDHAGQFTGPPCPIHCSPKVCFRCCLTVRRKWGGAPSCMNHMCFRRWRGKCSKYS